MESSAEENRLYIPSKKEVVEIMKKRGYTLTKETFDGGMLIFADMTPPNKMPIHKALCGVYIKNNMYMFTTELAPGVVKLSTDYFSCIEDESTFAEIESYINSIVDMAYSAWSGDQTKE